MKPSRIQPSPNFSLFPVDDRDESTRTIYRLHLFASLVGHSHHRHLRCALGPLVLVQRRALIADAIAHSSLPGLLGVFLSCCWLGFDGRPPVLLIAGSIVTGLTAVAIISSLTQRTIIHRDAAMAATLTAFFSLGMLLLQYISRHPLPGKAGIQDYLLGNASTLTRADVRSALVIGGGVLLILSLVHLKQTVVVFDAPFAQLAGIKLNIIR